MNQEPINVKIFGWHLYASREKLRIRRAATVHYRGNLTNRMRELRNRRYNKNGCCESCGEHGEKEQFQMHHILPFATFPQLARKNWNLIMLCPRCHYMIHNNPVWNAGLMQQIARKHNIDIEREYRHALTDRWTALQKEREGGEA